MAFDLQIDFTGMTLVHLVADATGPEGNRRYRGRALLLGGSHQPRLTLPVYFIRSRAAGAIPPRTRTLAAPDGVILAEVDLTNAIVRVELPADGVDLPRWDGDSPERLGSLGVDWEYLDYALDLKFQTDRSDVIADAPPGGAMVMLQQGRLAAARPVDPLMAATRWTVPSIKEGVTAREQPVAASFRWTCRIDAASVVVHVARRGEDVISMQIGPPPTARAPQAQLVAGAIASLCDLRAEELGSLTDVAQYGALLKPTVTPPIPTQAHANVSRDASGCPPARIFVR